jgi:2-methylisocitrate lyase-like PEP mutase family enzyme
VDAREEGAGILIMARTDARATHGLQEALWRARAFVDCGADIVFIEALESEKEMHEFCSLIKAPKMANMLEQGKTPLLPPARLEEIGFKIAAYPLTLLSAAARSMQDALADLQSGCHPQQLLEFEALQELAGFDAYFAEEERYKNGQGR